MPSLFMTLNTADTALSADQAVIETIGHNVANANTPGYSQQTVDLVPSPPYTIPTQVRPMSAGQLGTGVSVAGINRSRDPLLDIQYRYQNQLSGQWSTLQTQYQQLQGILPEPSTTGLGSQLSNFWNGWQAVANDPSNMGARATLQQSSIALTTAFNSASQQLTATQQVADASVQSSVTTINNNASQIANLNGQIMAVLANGQQPNDLMDQRDLLIDQISKIVPVITTAQPNGSVTVQLATQVPNSTTLQVANPSAPALVSSTTSTPLTFTSMGVPTYATTATNTGTETATVGGAYTGTSSQQYLIKVTGVTAGAVTGISYSTDGGQTYTASASAGSPFTLSNGVTMSFSGGTAATNDQFSFVASTSGLSAVSGGSMLNPGALTPANATGAPLGGQLGASIQMRDSVIGGSNGLISQLNTLAKEITLEVNTQHITGYDLTGATGNPYFNASPPYNTAASVATVTAANFSVTSAIANNVQSIAAASVTNAVGDGTIAQAIANIQTQNGAATDPLPNITIQQGYENVIASLGANAQMANNSDQNQTVVMQTLTNQRLSVSGVSSDEEMTKLVELQHSYAAAARVITAVDSMLDTIINHMGLGN